MDTPRKQPGGSEGVHSEYSRHLVCVYIFSICFGSSRRDVCPAIVEAYERFQKNKCGCGVRYSQKQI
jgi:hypothetical protein